PLPSWHNPKVRFGLFASVIGASLISAQQSCADDPERLGVLPGNIDVITSCPAPSVCRDTISVTFIGVGGFVIRSGAHAVMTGPLFTHPNFGELWQYRGSDIPLVRRMLDSVN